MNVFCFSHYLAQKLCFWTGIIFIGVYVSVCVCGSVCVCMGRLSQKSYWPILMKLGRMMYYDNNSVPFEDEINQFIRMEVTENLLFRHHELRPFDNFYFSYYFPFFII